MKAAYTLLGLLFLLVIIGANYAFNRAGNPAKVSDIISATSSMALSITSPAFEHNGKIPSKYTCDEDRSINPELVFSGVPEGTKSLALIMDDPDVPRVLHADGVFDHWVLFNIPPATKDIPENGSAGIAGANGAGKNAYTGPCPPPQYEPSEHRYIFVLYALDSELSLQAGASKQQVLEGMRGHILAQAELVGRYKRK